MRVVDVNGGDLGVCQLPFPVEPGDLAATTDDIFEIIANGRGAHAAMPHLGCDPMPYAAHVINALQTIVARNIHPLGHTRLPRYVRGKTGTIERDYGVFAFMETSALSLGDKPQHLYSVRFSARELWGKQAQPQDAVYVDLYDDYLEPA